MCVKANSTIGNHLKRKTEGNVQKNLLSAELLDKSIWKLFFSFFYISLQHSSWTEVNSEQGLKKNVNIFTPFGSNKSTKRYELRVGLLLYKNRQLPQEKSWTEGVKEQRSDLNNKEMGRNVPAFATRRFDTQMAGSRVLLWVPHRNRLLKWDKSKRLLSFFFPPVRMTRIEWVGPCAHHTISGIIRFTGVTARTLLLVGNGMRK